ncbi:hypothetical protein [Paracoccus sp. (in: a-proteobacteria)]|uniref:hypothetical protein n=1 Tax=Paracoccus sp. TaxID=267 RepID=UPI003A8A26BC
MMKRIKFISIAAAGSLFLAACAPEGSTGQTSALAAGSAAATANFNPAESAPVSAARAKALFEGVCAASLPNFKSAPNTMRAMGFTRPSPMGTATIYSASENASVQIIDGPGLGKTCSLVVGSKDSPDALRNAVLGPKQMKGTPFGGEYGALYQMRNVLIMSEPPLSSDGLTYMTFKMLSER